MGKGGCRLGKEPPRRESEKNMEIKEGLLCLGPGGAPARPPVICPPVNLMGRKLLLSFYRCKEMSL